MSWITTTRFPALPIARDPTEGVSSSRGEPGDIPDETLLSQTATGDQDALTILFRRYAGLVRGVSLRILRDEAEAEDLVQDLFLFIYREAAIFDNSKSSGRSWIVQMTFRRAISRRRYLTARGHYKNSEANCYCFPSPVLATAGYDSSMEALFGKERLKKVMEELTAEQHEVLRLHFYEGYTLNEIGQMLGQSLGNVRHHYYRGLGKLRKQVCESKLPNR